MPLEAVPPPRSMTLADRARESALPVISRFNQLTPALTPRSLE